MIGNGGTRMDPRLADSVISVLRFICETKPLVAEDDRIVIDGGLVRICEKNDVIALGEAVKSLAHDLTVVLRYSYEEHPGCASMVVKLEEAEQNLAVMLDTAGRWRSTLRTEK